MAAVQMYIDKFNGVVKINEDHPLAIAQRAKDARPTAVAPPGAEHTESPTVATAAATGSAQASTEAPKVNARRRPKGR